MIQNNEPKKWREGIDPFTLPLKKIQISDILGYPHAANQVFYLKGISNGQEGYYYLKYADHMDANLQNEVEILQQLHIPQTPLIIEYDTQNYRYSLTAQLNGKRLSVLLAETNRDNSLGFLFEYGRVLATLHCIEGNFPRAPHRRFHDIPDKTYFEQHSLDAIYKWLTENKPLKHNECFIHGDFHYANILWSNGYISGILDFELAGIGNREFDIAWALILRPGQMFLKTEAELREFLAGYASVAACDQALVRYYMVLIYSRFLKFGDEEYEKYVRQWLAQAIS